LMGFARIAAASWSSDASPRSAAHHIT
jgi:hypothetical protein